MKLLVSLVILICTLFAAKAFPSPVFSSSGNVDTWLFGDASRGGRVLSHSYNPYINKQGVRARPTTYSLWKPETELTPLTAHQAIQYHQADRRRQALLEVNDTPSQENEVREVYPQEPSPAVVPIEATELIIPAEQAPVVSTTVKAIVPELIVPEIEEAQEEPVQQPKKAVPNKKQVKRPVDEEDDDENEDYPAHLKFSAGAFFPMIFGWGGSGPTAVANAYSTGKGGAAASESIAYGSLRPVERSP